MGLFSFALGYVKSEAELFRMFKTDFEGLIQLCQ